MKIDGNQLIDFNQTLLFENGKKLTSLDEHSSEQFLEVYAGENINTANNNPLLLVLDESVPTNNSQLQVKKMTNSSQIPIGILNNKIAKPGDKIRVLTRGIVEASYVLAPVVGKIIYPTNEGKFTLMNINPQIKIGRIIEASPCKVYIDVNNELQYKTNFENFGSFESLNLEAALRKMFFLSGRPSYKTCVRANSSGSMISVAFNSIQEKKDQGVGTNQAYIWYTQDRGVTWFLSNATLGTLWKQIICVNGRFVAVGNTAVGYSDNGMDWTISNATSGKSIAYGNGFFIIVGNSSFSHSTDGINWVSGGAITDLNSVAYSETLDMFFGVGGTNVGRKFTNPLTFYTTVSNVILPTLSSYLSVVCGFDKFVAAGSSGIAWSFDGITWFSNAEALDRIDYGNMMYINQTKISSDGVKWSNFTPPDDAFFAGITKDNYVFYSGNGAFPFVSNAIMIL